MQIIVLLLDRLILRYEVTPLIAAICMSSERKRALVQIDVLPGKVTICVSKSLINQRIHRQWIKGKQISTKQDTEQ